MTSVLKQNLQILFEENASEWKEIIQLPRSKKRLEELYNIFVSSEIDDLDDEETKMLFIEYFTDEYLYGQILEEIKDFHDEDEELKQIIGDFDEKKYLLPRSKYKKIELLKYLWNENVYQEDLRELLLNEYVRKRYLNKIISNSCVSTSPTYCKGRSKLSMDEKFNIIKNDARKVDKVLDILNLEYENNEKYNSKIDKILDHILEINDF